MPSSDTKLDLSASTQVCICADDFGLESGVDQGIAALAERGRLTAISCLSTGPTFGSDADMIRGLDVDIGLHLNFTESLGQPGLFMPIGKLILSTYLRRLPTVRIHEQINRQLDAFESVMGRAPDFVDGHLHIHQLPQIRDSLIEQLTKRYGNSPSLWMRDTMPGPLRGSLPIAQRLKAHLIGSLGAKRLKSMASHAGIRMNQGGFFGVYDFARPHPPYPQMLEAWLAQMGQGALLMVHPAQSIQPGDLFGQDRVEEYRVLGGVAFENLLMRMGIRPARLSHISASTKPDLQDSSLP